MYIIASKSPVTDQCLLPIDVVECRAVVGELLEQKLARIGEAAPTVAAVGTRAAVGAPSTSSSVAVETAENPTGGG